MIFLLHLTLFALLSSAKPNDNTIATCSYLHNKYSDLLIWDPLGAHGPSTIGKVGTYHEITSDYWNQKNSQNRAACIFTPKNAAQVSDAVKKINEFPDVEFALKSAGHNANLGYSSVNQGVMISFRPHMRSTVLAPDHKTAAIGPGSHWGEAYEETLKHGKIVVGGRLAHIGVGGFTLGGGLSYLSSQYVRRLEPWMVVRY